MRSPASDQVGWMFLSHDDVIKWKHFPRHWPFVRGIHWSPVNSPHKGQWRGVLMFFYLRLNKRLSKQSWGRWFETLSRPLWRHSNVTHKSNGPTNSTDCRRYFPNRRKVFSSVNCMSDNHFKGYAIIFQLVTCHIVSANTYARSHV